jgi:regulator of replication initiation timing
MKNYTAIITASLILTGITMYSLFKYDSCLKQHNNALSVNINQIIKRIETLEADKTMKQIIALRLENIALKKEIGNLKSELTRVSPKTLKPCSRQPRQDTKTEKKSAGNQGFLVKDGKPIH